HGPPGPVSCRTSQQLPSAGQYASHPASTSNAVAVAFGVGIGLGVTGAHAAIANVRALIAVASTPGVRRAIARVLSSAAGSRDRRPRAGSATAAGRRIEARDDAGGDMLRARSGFWECHVRSPVPEDLYPGLEMIREISLRTASVTQSESRTIPAIPFRSSASAR